MPHISVKCYPKNLSQEEFKSFVSELTDLVEKHLKSPADFLSVEYTEIAPENWDAEVYQPEIKAKWDKLAKTPNY